MLRLPSVSPAPTAEDISFSPALSKALRRANELMKEKGDSFVSIDHVILALIEEPTFVNLIKESGTTVDKVKLAISQVRGGKKVDSKQAEGNFEALSKCECLHYVAF